MPLQTSYPIYDPYSKAMPNAEHISDYKMFERRAKALIKKVYDAGIAAGKHDPFEVCCINREHPGHHTYLRLAMDMPELDVRCDLQYGGAMGHAEQILEGMWRIASADEEKVCRQKDIDATAAVLKKRDLLATAGADAMGARIAQAINQNRK